jgi:hypothetical protein
LLSLIPPLVVVVVVPVSEPLAVVDVVVVVSEVLPDAVSEPLLVPSSPQARGQRVTIEIIRGIRQRMVAVSHGRKGRSSRPAG